LRKVNFVVEEFDGATTDSDDGGDLRMIKNEHKEFC
jgi:hypothetical protein